MRVFAVSDLHLDYAPNREWLEQLSLREYRGDVLILAGDISDKLPLLAEGFNTLMRRFASVLYVPGNHDLWISTDGLRDSFEKFAAVRETATQYGVRMTPFRHDDLAIVPLLGWYDYSFGEPDGFLKSAWVDYRACRWPDGYDDAAVTRFFTERNPDASSPELEGASKVITFSHFLPRIDLMPDRIPSRHRKIYPVLGTTILETQIRQLGSSMHVYGHSHVNRHITLDGVTYINNAFGYPAEAHFTGRRLVHIHTVP
ncbi:serine/threonine protein phosphatase [Dyella lipolytica]|uniref:Metallophosphoesterase n=1 Tax=Dyella lipolytica TaxID=1867835 RepID=A0ABW8J0V2_9GAMM|nr:metallophosphoesterase [Dyella lipolytica]GLQ45304.1 serine/threonine protein phosphatase [Dyella lipolytica]